MCARYTLVKTERLVERFGFEPFDAERQPLYIQPRFNIAPTQPVTVVTATHKRRRLREMARGFRPWWLKDSKRPVQTNAKVEAIGGPLWRLAVSENRCLVLADGFYEWPVRPDGKKQPIYVRLRSGEPFAFAGVYTQGPDDRLTCALLTTTPNSLMPNLHNRMPAILTPEAESWWLDPTILEADEVLGCVQPYDADAMEAFPVDPRVGNWRFDDPGLIEPLTDAAPVSA